jgi:hypothetical protein
MGGIFYKYYKQFLWRITMNLNEAKQILNTNGYKMEMPLDEALEVLKSHGFLCEAENEEELEDDFEEDPEEDEDDGLSQEQKHRLSSILKKLRGVKDYTTYVKALQGLKPEQAELLQKVVGDGEFAKDVTVKKGSLSVKLLHPTQQEIDVNNSLYYPLKKNPAGPPSVLDVLKGGSPFVINNNPIIVYKYAGKYFIIDGHHRWSQIFLLNPNAKMKCILYSAPESDEDPVSMLRDFQLVIKATTGQVKIADANSDYNIYTMSNDKVKDYVLNTITDESLDLFKKFESNGKSVFEDKESVANYIVKNGDKLRSENGPAEGAPRRNVMPQTDSETLAVAAKGMTDV